MRTVLRVLTAGFLLVLLLLGGTWAWAFSSSSRALDRSIHSHSVHLPIPFPLSPEEAEALGVEGEAAQIMAVERAVDRGRHLLEARYACADCHGENYGGGVMVDAFPVGSFLGPNLTSGQGSKVNGYTPADWDRAVRHGILPDGRPSIMPSQDFARMSDQELSDIIVYLRALPAVDNDVPPSRVGPLSRLLLAAGKIPLSVDLIGSHEAEHLTVPPVPAVNVEFGQHLAAVCSGCHGESFTGGPVPGGDPSWLPAANLTPHPEGLSGWSYGDFLTAMTEGRRPDGTTLGIPMTAILPYAQRMTEVELQALWSYFSTLDGRPTGR